MAKTKRKKKNGWIKALTMIILSVMLFVAILLLLFHVREIDVQGTVYSSKSEVVKWLNQDKSTANSIYAWWKCKYKDTEKPPAIEKIDVKFKTPWSIILKVKEKTPIGYIEYKHEYLYFAQDGIAIYKADQKLKNVSYIEGMDIKETKVKIGKVIPVEDKKVFQRIMEVSELLLKFKLKPDRIVCDGSNLNLYFGEVEILLGKSDYSAKLAQIPPILKILGEKYPGIKGTLYLEHFEKIEKGIRFVPEKDEVESEENSDQSQTNEGLENEESQSDDTSQEDQQQEQDTEVIEYTPEDEDQESTNEDTNEENGEF